MQSGDSLSLSLAEAAFRGLDPDRVAQLLVDSLGRESQHQLYEWAMRGTEQPAADWGERYFYIEDPCDTETGTPLTPGPIRLFPIQKALLKAALEVTPDLGYRWQTIVYSSIKKSGKSRLAAMVDSWVADQMGPYAEVYLAANDGKQSGDRLLNCIKRSIELNQKLGTRLAMARWRSLQSSVTLPNGSVIEAIPVDPTGQAGANPACVTLCLDEETEVLTWAGWKQWDELGLMDSIATLGPERRFEWQRPRALHVFRYNGEMWRCQHREYNALVTPGHKVHGEFYTSESQYDHGKVAHDGLMPVEEAVGYGLFRPTMTCRGWRGVERRIFRIPGTQRKEPLDIPMFPWAQFLGWYLSEGCVVRGRGGRPEGILIPQSAKANPRKREAILSLLMELGFKPCEWADEMNIAIWDVRVAAYCEGFGKSDAKFIPQWLKDSSRDILEAFLAAYKEGDGIDNTPHCFTISTSSRRMMDDLMEVGQKLGYRVSYGMSVDNRWDEPKTQYRVSFTDSGYRPRVGREHWSREDYAGVVFCPTTANGVILVRRNGRCYWTGNSELWGYRLEHKQRLWAALTLSPTKRGMSFRWADTYAGYEGESPTLEDLYDKTVARGRYYVDWADENHVAYDPLLRELALPLFVNESGRIWCYWETEPRYPWQTPEYYEEQAATLPEMEFRRVHKNEWVTSEDVFVPIEWWHACQQADKPFPPLGRGEYVILGVDAAVSGDSFAVVGVTRHPLAFDTHVAVRYCRVWYPPKGGELDFEPIDREIRAFCAEHDVVEVAYDRWQLHKMASDQRRDQVAHWRPFGQQAERLEADAQLYQLIRAGQIVHDGTHGELTRHVANANSKMSKEEETKLRIVKSQRGKIDACVALSMAAHRCLYLNL